jgi:DNA ligase-1
MNPLIHAASALRPWARRCCISICLVLGFIAPAYAYELPLLLAQRGTGDVDVRDYWVSEKLDGVRAFWDGQQLRFRSGRLIDTPSWFIAALPQRALDGELWLGRGQFEHVVRIVRRKIPQDHEWKAVRYMIFELPDAPGTFTNRYEQMRSITSAAAVPWVQTITQFRLADAQSLQAKLADIVKADGEGLMLHRADAPYVTGRSAHLLKITPWEDAEARVVAHVPGKGKLTGKTGALVVEGDNGQRFRLGSGLTAMHRHDPPPIGTVVTYRFREKTRNGLPRFPRFLRIRELF